jgi:hypothetical protein
MTKFKNQAAIKRKPPLDPLLNIPVVNLVDNHINGHGLGILADTAQLTKRHKITKLLLLKNIMQQILLCKRLQNK